jgi:hypothetical protein
LTGKNNQERERIRNERMRSDYWVVVSMGTTTVRRDALVGHVGKDILVDRQCAQGSGGGSSRPILRRI